MMLSDLERPVVFAHRGASAHAPENTLAAFRLAAELSAPAVELDAKLSSDGVPVVFHDATLVRTTGAAGKLSECSLAELKTLDAGSHFGPQFAGEPIPTLEEVFQEVGDRLFINVELTNYATPNDRLVEKVVELICRMEMSARVLFSSFYPANLQTARRLLPGVPCGLLVWSGGVGLLARSFFNRWVPHEALHPFTSDVTARMIQQQHRAGKRVHVWTVNDPDEMRRLFSLGVDGIFTDDPALALGVREECG